MPVSRRSEKPAGITNQSGEPELELEINGLKLSMAPPKAKAEQKEPKPAGSETGESAS